MKIALIGASGFVGGAVLDELIRRNHQVTAIVRRPERVKKAANVTAVKADVMKEDEVSEAVTGHDIVVSAFNPGWTNPNMYTDFLQGAKAIQKGVKKSGVKRLFVVGGGGSLFVAPGQQLVDSPNFPPEYRAGALAARDYLNIIKNDRELQWTFLSPSIEMNHSTSGVRTGKYRTGFDNPVFNDEGRSVISVEDLAVAIADEAENAKHLRRRFTVAY